MICYVLLSLLLFKLLYYIDTGERNVMYFYCFCLINTFLCFVLGADVNKATTNNDHTVLSLACAGGHLAVVELLLKSGAKATHKLKVKHAVQ